MKNSRGAGTGDECADAGLLYHLLVREDLRNTKRQLIAEKLHLSPNTVTAYRSTIRKKFMGQPEAQRPIWMLAWLRRFPGTKLALQRPRRPAK